MSATMCAFNSVIRYEGATVLRSVHEQGCRVVHKGIRLLADRSQRWDRIHDFSIRFQRKPAGRQDGQARAALNHLIDQRGARDL